MRAKLIVLSILLLLLTIPNLAMAAGNTHYFECSECHLAGLSVITLQNNLCLKCHDTDLGNTTTFNEGNPQLYNSAEKSDAKFASQDASDVYNTAVGGITQNSHNWGSSATNAAAGATNPSRALHPTMSGYRGRNTLNLNCARCHSPHGAYDPVNNPSLLVASDDLLTTMAVDDLCQNCHTDFSGGNAAPSARGFLTHPLPNTAQLVALQADENRAPNYYNILALPLYNVTAPYANNVQLVNDASGNPGISCMSCHGLHFTDSDSTTADGPTAPAQTGDGLLLRSDGPTKTGVDRNETAQRRSNLCQTCHTYKLHGASDSTNRIGCLDCHGGHSYNNNTPSSFVLADVSPTPVPTYNVVVSTALSRIYDIVKQVDYPVLLDATSTRVSWSNSTPSSTDGFCEKCHGDVQDDGPDGGVGKLHLQHLISGSQECTDCHNHDNATGSFDLDESAATCGDCHGFPPFVDGAGNRNGTGTDGGYAYNDQDEPKTWNYVDNTDYEKNEENTAHKTHSGGQLVQNSLPVEGRERWYTFNETEVDNCKICHGPKGGEAGGGHRQDPVLFPETFRDVPIHSFAGIANAYNAIGTTVYNVDSGGSCSNVYCHSAGGPRDGAGGRDYTAGLQTTVAWVGTGGSAGYNSITVSGSRCSTCHGNDTGTMTAKNNTWEVHDAHFNSASIGTNCSICHLNSAADWQTLSSNAKDHTAGSDGDHVNGIVDVVYNTTVMGGLLSGETYDANGDGTCSVYCHNADNTSHSADWDVAGALACDSCHRGRVGDGQVINSGTHTRHVSDPFGPQLACSDCHDTGADAGTHAGHFDGQLILNSALVGVAGDGPLVSDTADICLNCHGYDAGEVQPLWTVPATTDCATCHAGPNSGGSFNNGQPQVPNHLPASRTGGHNRPAASNNYNSGNFAANLDCDACHITTDTLKHWDGLTGTEADLMLRTDAGYNSSYLGGLENNFCQNCHGDSPAHPNSAVNTATLGIQTHSAKKCVACHNVHGEETNIQMVWEDRVAQNQHDDTFGQYKGSDVFFTNNSDFTGIGAASYDEDDNDDGAATESNADDICAVCHSDGTIDPNFNGSTYDPVLHNKIEDDGADHSVDVIGTDCFDSCHSVHNDAGGAFLPSAGTSCSGCHDYPPDTAAHNMHAVEMGSRTAIDTDDQSDCENCHTGASSYTYSTTVDQGNSLNHSNDPGRLSILNSAVGFGKGTGDRWTCTKACHNTDTSDGYWYTWDNVGNEGQAVSERLPFDSDGLACDKCHYYADAGSESDTDNTNHGSVGDGRAEKISEISHNEHFLKNKSCGACHDIGGVDYANGSPLPGPLAHIDDRTGGNRGAVYNGAAMALKDESGSDVLPALTYNSANTCATAGGTGCHAGSTDANWDTPFDGTTNSGCLECHTVNGNPDYDPFSGLHTNAMNLTVTGNSHDDSFYNGDGVAGVADCVTCHTAQPTISAPDHINGFLDDGVNKITVYANAGYDWTANTCATVTECHSANQSGSNWEYKWSTTVYNTTGAQCDNCHGGWGDWRTGVTHRMDGPVQGKHANGTDYLCNDCHALEALSGNYAFSSGDNDWDDNDPGKTGQTAESSNHGDGFITMNLYNTTFGRNGSNLSGCASCHAAYDGTATGQYSFDTTNWTNSSVLGDQIERFCSDCHGGLAHPGTNQKNFWPDNNDPVTDSDENNRGAHEKHIVALAEMVYPNDKGADAAGTIANLLSDATNHSGTSEERQIELCAYCHQNHQGDGAGHTDSVLPAETLADANDSNTPGQGFFPLWDTNRSGSRDSADYDTAGSGSCYVSSCHYDRATDANATNYGWYAGNSTSCEICHNPNDVDTNANAGGLTHQEHLNSASLTGLDITCNHCHQTATEDVSWSPGVAPTEKHINGTYMDALSGSVIYSYNLGTDQSCGTNDCHNLGNGTTPKTPVYGWFDGALPNCTICHLDPPDTDTHPVHMASTSYVDCLNCHEPATDPTHMDTFVTYNTTTIGNPPGDGSCTNTCHDAGGALDWEGPFTTLACADCHNAGASIAGEPTSGLHVTYNVTAHNSALMGGGNCVNCHDATDPVPAATHGDGTLDPWSVNYNFDANVVGYNPATGCMAALPCHTDDGDWRRKWTGFVDEIPTGAHIPGVSGVCDNCHGSSTTFDDPTQWRWDEASNSDHTDPYASNPQGNKMDAHGDCATCHGWGHADYDKEWGAPGINNGHGDGSITMNGPADTGAKYNVATGSCDNAGCHSPANSPDYNLQYNSGFTLNYGDFGGGSGGPCDSCHGGSGYYAPNGTPGSFPNRAGLHLEHITAMEAKGIGHSTTCTYCHGDDPGSADWHNDGTGTLPQHNAAILGYRRIIGGGIDSDGFFNFSGTEKSTCSNIDCHFNNSYTPHWYDSDNVEPGAVSLLTNTVSLEPCSIKVTYNSPGADAGLDNTTAYRYDARVSTGAIGSDGNLFNAATLVGGLPASYLRNELTEVTVSNLLHTNNYYFAVRAQDTEGLWGPISSIGPISPTPDTEPPMFYGADKALAGDEGAAINLYWTEAEDHSMYVMDPDPANRLQKPIRYEIWLKSEVRGDLDMDDNTGYNSAILWDTLQTFYTGNAIELEGLYNHTNGGVSTTIQNDITYQMGVRACDYHDNCETNKTIVKVTPAAAATVPQNIYSYVSNGGNELFQSGTPGGAATPAPLNDSSIVFYGSTQGHAVTYLVDSFTIQYTEDKDASTLTAELGKWTGICDNADIVATNEVYTSKNTTNGLITFKFGAVTPVSAETGQSFCIKISTPHQVDLAYGDVNSQGVAQVVEVKQNNPPVPVTSPTISMDGAKVLASWAQPGDDNDGLTTEETNHYDIYGSNNGSSFDYVISEDHDWDDLDVEWDTQADGITEGDLWIKIRSGDGFTHASDGASTFAVPGGSGSNIDRVAPSQVEDLKALPRPKKGTVQLRWTTPGDDYMNNGRAQRYEIRYSESVPISDFNTATLVENEPPTPDFGGHIIEFEVTGLPQEIPLYFALKTFDEQDNVSSMSNQTLPVNSGPSCGMCHTTGPSVVESEGNHKLHGYTLYDCDKCHTYDPGGPQEEKVSDFGLDHQDGKLVMGYGPQGAVEGVVAGDTITYTDSYNSGTVMYVDTDGFGGFGQPSDQYNTAIGDKEDDGSCFNFGFMGVGGCHGPAGSDPDSTSGNSEYPTFETPDWSSTANLDCGRCHGNPNRDENSTGWIDGSYKKDPYGRDYDGTLYNSPTKPAGVVPDQIIGSPGADNRGGWDPSGLGTVDERKYIGQHEKHLNYSFRFSKGDSCNLCHYGHYADMDNLDGRHGNGEIDVLLDKKASGPDAHYNSAGAGVAGQCFSMDPYNCHPTTEAPAWDTDENFPCIGCHTMGGESNIAQIGHYQDLSAQTGGLTIDDSGSAWYEGNPGNCTWCHFAGHPTDDVDGTALILPNNPQVGITYKSGGIHLRKQPGGGDGTHTSYPTQAELCWGCHYENTVNGTRVSEWGADDGLSNYNSGILPANGHIYDFGYVDVPNWTTATWSSAYSFLGNESATPYFEYKTGAIQSTHSTNITYGNSAVLDIGGQYVESPDDVADLQCHNCHDVHNMNFAKGDNSTGPPYLRGSWLSNPYREDGAPRGPNEPGGSGNTTFVNVEPVASQGFGPVPRALTLYNEIGGYQIDQNNGHVSGPPTKGWVAQTAGGLCLLCHGSKGVDGMDQKEGEDLWITAGKNGHSNSALGGTAAGLEVTNVFSFGDRNVQGGPPLEYLGDYGTVAGTTNAAPGNPAMGYVNAVGINSVSFETSYFRGDGFRSNWGFGWEQLYADPDVTPVADFPFQYFDWGVTQDTDTINKGYHAFSCSKCHNPHASRLPKLMITNCLDTKQNTWDDQWAGPTGSSNAQGSASPVSADNEGKTLSNLTSAQNCHRVGDPNQSNGPGTGKGWNLVTPRSTIL